MKTTQGFGIVEAIIIVVVAAVLAVVGLTFYNNMTARTVDTQTTAETINVPAATIETTADLNTVTAELDQIDMEDPNDSSALDEQQAAF